MTQGLTDTVPIIRQDTMVIQYRYLIDGHKAHLNRNVFDLAVSPFSCRCFLHKSFLHFMKYQILSTVENNS